VVGDGAMEEASSVGRALDPDSYSTLAFARRRVTRSPMRSRSPFPMVGRWPIGMMEELHRVSMCR
jgi:hypothetical protein